MLKMNRKPGGSREVLLHSLERRADLNGRLGTVGLERPATGERYPVQLRPNTSDPPTSESTEGVGVQAKRDNIYPGSLSTAMSWTWCAEQGRAVVLWIDEGMMSATLVPGLSVATMTVE